MKHKHVNILILGAGPAGCTAAVYAARAMLNPILLQGPEPGGQLTITSDVENYPAFPSILGPTLMDNMIQHAQLAGAQLLTASASSVNLSSRPFLVLADDDSSFLADTLVVATGAAAKWLGVPGEDQLKGRGVSACATCDGFFFKNQTVAVVGGGDVAAEEALFLTRFADVVHLIHRRDALRASPVMQQRLFNHDKIQIHWDAVVNEIVGNTDMSAVKSLSLIDVKTQQTRSLPTNAAFIAIGHQPRTELFKNQLILNPDQTIKITPGSTHTSVPGVFAAGDVADSVYRQAVTSAGSGCAAALDASKFLDDNPT